MKRLLIWTVLYVLASSSIEIAQIMFYSILWGTVIIATFKITEECDLKSAKAETKVSIIVAIVVIIILAIARERWWEIPILIGVILIINVLVSMHFCTKETSVHKHK